MEIRFMGFHSTPTECSLYRQAIRYRDAGDVYTQLRHLAKKLRCTRRFTETARVFAASSRIQ